MDSTPFSPRAILLLLLLGACAHPRFQVHKGAFLLDVRSPAEFAQGHPPGAVNVPMSELEATLASLPADRSREITVYCRSAPCSSKARSLLLRAGFAKVEDAVFTAGR